MEERRNKIAGEFAEIDNQKAEVAKCRLTTKPG